MNRLREVGDECVYRSEYQSWLLHHRSGWRVSSAPGKRRSRLRKLLKACCSWMVCSMCSLGPRDDTHHTGNHPNHYTGAISACDPSFHDHPKRTIIFRRDRTETMRARRIPGLGRPIPLVPILPGPSQKVPCSASNSPNGGIHP